MHTPTFRREPEDALVKAGFKDNLFVTGWGELRIKALSDELAHPALTNSLADYEASGFAEGYLTAHHTYNQYRNLLVVMAEGKIAPNIEKWFGQQLTWSRKMCRTKAKSDNLWRHTGA
ncbi:hypothetical protein SARC_10091 [Sphaeroforma arctica JP610]|uniref:Phospholipase B-like n=1 Tax=Sphaeroforma arctica JP610 TaxID=667725 RepID=A0A0L0FKY3_9EUKA|nr:hypothetical protein SARC_10091 [Sphaeroforma arctica JP610]KNC77447.1 hypothetical protein SARC_10091 [Sphaeroforma arctica JP610]|eukprot:XP_014151349.1 hypothetical protein SARC_10091 [Sphaeroforma arctica JP610]